MQQVLDGRQLGGRLQEFPAFDGQVGGGHAATHLAVHSRRGNRHDVDLPGRPFDVTDGGEQLRQMDVLQLLRATRGQELVEVLAGSAKRLPPLLRLGTEAFGVLALQFLQQLLVEGVAVDGDLLDQLGQRDGRVVGVGPVAADARSHQHRAGQHRRLLEQHLLARQAAAAAQTVEHGVERRLLQHEAAATPGAVQLVHVPLAEQVVGPLVQRVVEVVRPRIKGQLVELVQGEHGVKQDRGIGRVEDGQRGLDQLTIGADGRPRPANPKRDRTHPFVLVGLNLLLGAQHGHGPVPDVIVQLAEHGRDDPLGLIPRPALLEHRLAHPANEERLKQAGFGLMEQQIAVELAIGRQRGVEHQSQDGLRLLDLPEGVGRAADGLQLAAQGLVNGPPRRSPVSLFCRQRAKQLVDVFQEPGVRRAGGEVQIAEDFLGGSGYLFPRPLVVH